MATMKTVKLPAIPRCDLCYNGPTPAVYDAKLTLGGWAYVCETHYRAYAFAAADPVRYYYLASRLALASPADQARAALIEEIKQYALDNYGKGWGLIVETYTDAEIEQAIGRATTLKGALRKLRPAVSVYRDRVADAENSAF